MIVIKIARLTHAHRVQQAVLMWAVPSRLVPSVFAIAWRTHVFCIVLTIFVRAFCNFHRFFSLLILNCNFTCKRIGWEFLSLIIVNSAALVQILRSYEFFIVYFGRFWWAHQLGSLIIHFALSFFDYFVCFLFWNMHAIGLINREIIYILWNFRRCRFSRIRIEIFLFFYLICK